MCMCVCVFAFKFSRYTICLFYYRSMFRCRLSLAAYGSVCLCVCVWKTIVLHCNFGIQSTICFGFSHVLFVSVSVFGVQYFCDNHPIISSEILYIYLFQYCGLCVCVCVVCITNARIKYVHRWHPKSPSNYLY